MRSYRMMIVSLAVYILFVGLFSFWYTQRAERELLRTVDGKLLVAATALKFMLANDFHDRATGPDAIGFDEEMANRERLNAFVQSSGLTYAYTLVENRGRYYFSAPTVSPEEAEELRRWYYYPYREIPEEFRRAINGTEPVMVTYSDEWGTFRSVALPQVSPGGRHYLACADFAINKYNALIDRKRMESFGIAALFLLFTVPFIVTHRVQSRRYSTRLARANARLAEHRDQLEKSVEQRTRELQLAKDRAEEAERAKSRFLAVMSHEIRTPLNTILGMAEVLDAPNLSRRQRRGLENIADAGGHLLELITDILDISRIESGVIELEERPFDLPELLTTSSRVVRNAAGGNAERLQFSLNIDPVVAPHRVGDPMRLRQVLVNLLSNAFKFTRQGGVVLSVTPQGEQDLHFCVSDTGIGIPQDKLAGIFEDYAQADSSTTREFGGTGLGLSICRRLVEAMAGRLWVESIPGQGTQFHFVLPLPVTGHQPEGAVTSGLTPPTEADVPDVRVLVAEDMASNYEIVELFLEGTPARPERATNGQEAVDMAADGGYGLALMDLHMPEMDGIEAVRLIRARERVKGLPRLPVIALTADAIPSSRRVAREAGCDEILTKPLTRSELLAAIIRRADIAAGTAADLASRAAATPDRDEGVQALLPVFIEELGEGLAAMQQWLDSGELDSVARMAHGLKGAARSYGLPEMGEQMRAVEQAAKDGDTDELDAALRVARTLAGLPDSDESSGPAPS